jgi:hypothetical protein
MSHRIINDIHSRNWEIGGVIDSCLSSLLRWYTEYAYDAINKNEFEKLANYCIDCAKSNKKGKETEG